LARERHGPGLTGKALKKAKNRIRRKIRPRLQEANSKRSQKRREARALNVCIEKPIKELPISEHGRCGRHPRGQIYKALGKANHSGILEVIREFTQVPQIKCVLVFGISQQTGHYNSST
jgi:hypothetical protein